MISITVPSTRSPEREYILSVIFGDFLGLEYRVQYHTVPEIHITTDNPGGDALLALPDTFFSSVDKAWLAPETLPTMPLAEWKVQGDLPEASVLDSILPIIYGCPLSGDGTWFEQSNTSISLGLDVFGSAFFMLTRYEETAKPVLDEHERFPATASLAYKSGFLDRPIINEYLEVLWACIKRLWPSMQRRRRLPKTLVSHDVDWPLTPSGSAPTLLKNTVGDIVWRRSPRTAYKRLRGYMGKTHGDFSHDPYNTFDELMTLSEDRGLKSAFYFIADHTAGPIDGKYELQDAFIVDLMKEIHMRGHEIGLHPSYYSYRNPGQIAREHERLREATDRLGISQPAWGGRQHYLRWEAPTTWQAWHDAGLDYDSTVGFADHAG